MPFFTSLVLDFSSLTIVTYLISE